MLKFEVYQGSVRLRMSGEYPILVDFPLYQPEKKFNLYYINMDGIWIKKVDYGLYDIYRGENPSQNLRQIGNYYDD